MSLLQILDVTTLSPKSWQTNIQVVPQNTAASKLTIHFIFTSLVLLHIIFFLLKKKINSLSKL
jgi:hypothetical protein